MNPICKHSSVSVTSSAILLAWGISGASVLAASSASDTAANYAVSGWSTTPANNGTGFGAWTITAANANNPPYVGTYLDQTSYGHSDSVLSGGYAWATYANGGSGNGSLTMYRPFLTGGGSASLVNQTFSVGLGSAGIGGSGSSIDLNIGTAFSVDYIAGGTDNMVVSVDGAAATAIPVNFSNLGGGLQVALAVSGPLNSTTEGYTLTLSPFAGGAAYYTTSGTFDASTYNTSSFSFADNNTSGGDQFINNLNITASAPTPEPSEFALCALSGVALMMGLKRRK
jgi:hypothetical protein